MGRAIETSKQPAETDNQADCSQQRLLLISERQYDGLLLGTSGHLHCTAKKPGTSAEKPTTATEFSYRYGWSSCGHRNFADTDSSLDDLLPSWKHHFFVCFQLCRVKLSQKRILFPTLFLLLHSHYCFIANDLCRSGSTDGGMPLLTLIQVSTCPHVLLILIKEHLTWCIAILLPTTVIIGNTYSSISQ